jgi:hypothetical protein
MAHIVCVKLISLTLLKSSEIFQSKSARHSSSNSSLSLERVALLQNSSNGILVREWILGALSTNTIQRCCHTGNLQVGPSMYV